MKYKVEITEWLQKVVEVEASDKNEACRKVSEMYRNSEIVLNDEDFLDKEITLFEEDR